MPRRVGLRRFPHLIVSIDFIKSDRYRDDFVRDGPELVIVDEAHTCAFGQEQGRGQAAAPRAGQGPGPERRAPSHPGDRHPAQRQGEAFRSLLGPARRGVPELARRTSAATPTASGASGSPSSSSSAAGPTSATTCRRTPPSRNARKRELDYQLTPEYRQLFKRVLDFVRESVTEDGTDRRRQRVRWWSALALLRSPGLQPGRRGSDPAQPRQGRGRRDPGGRRGAGPPRRAGPRRRRARGVHGRRPGRRHSDRATRTRKTRRVRRRLLRHGPRGRQALRRGGRQAAEHDQDRARPGQRRLQPDPLLPLHPHRRVPRRAPAQAPCPRASRSPRSPACCRPPSASSASPSWARPTSASWSPPTA